MQLMVNEHYGQISKETAVLSASPLGLIILVYDRTIDCLSSAKRAIESNGNPRSDVDRAFRLIQQGLLNVIDYNAGEVATNLSTLYRWALRQLLMASMSKDLERIDAVIDAFQVVRSGWQELLEQSQSSSHTGLSAQQPEPFATQYSVRA